MKRNNTKMRGTKPKPQLRITNSKSRNALLIDNKAIPNKQRHFRPKNNGRNG
jgi:hypothetical protein